MLKMDTLYVDDEDLNGYKITQLRDYLKRFGQFVSGKKDELIVRAKGVKILGLQPVETNRQNDNTEKLVRKTEKQTTPLGETIPEINCLKGWSSDVSLIPDFNDSDVYNYLVLHMRAKRQLKSKVFFVDRHVHSILFHPISDECSHCVIKCKVVPSLPSSNQKENPDYIVWASLSKVTGNVHSADCTCTAGLGEACNHIGALLHALVDITDKKRDGLLASTSIKCAWNNPRKRKLSPKKSQNMWFRKSAAVENCPSSTAASFVHSFPSTIHEDRLHKRLLKCGSKAGWLTNFEKPSKQEDTIDNIPSMVTFMYRDNVDLDSSEVLTICKNFFENLTVSQEQCNVIEKESRGQSKSTVWNAQRQGRITSSNFGSVFIRKHTTQPDNLVKVLCGYTSFDNRFVKWGRDHEPAARRMYENGLKKQNRSASVSVCGLVINPLHPHLGASPDGLVFDPSAVDCNGLLEIKCPASDKWRNLSPLECAMDSGFFCELNASGDIKLKRAHPYYFQIQGQMGVSGRKWCDFVVWTLKQPHSVERIHFDPELWKSMLTKLNQFYIHAIIPELMSNRVKRGIPLYK